MKKGCAYWFSRSFMSLIIVVISIFLLLSGLHSYSNYQLNFLVLSVIFAPIAFFLGLLLLFFMDLGFGMFEGDVSDKVCGFLLIAVSLAVPFIWANFAKLSQYTYFPFPWWLIPFAASLMMLLWSGFAYVQENGNPFKAQKAKNG